MQEKSRSDTEAHKQQIIVIIHNSVDKKHLETRHFLETTMENLG